MKSTSNRIGRNSSTKTAAPQEAKNTDGASFASLALGGKGQGGGPDTESALKQPYSGLVAKVMETLENLERSGRAASALCLMNSDQIAEFIKDFAGFDRFEVSGFGEGQLALAQDVANQFDQARMLYRSGVNHLINNALFGKGSTEMENAVDALCHLLDVQVTVLSMPKIASVVSCNFSVMERLKSAWNAAHLACRALHEQTRLSLAAA